MNDNPPSPSPRAAEVFSQALDTTDPRQRNQFLDQACKGDPALRQQVDRLLAHHKDDSFLEHPAACPETTATVVTAPRHEATGIRQGDDARIPPGEQVGDTLDRYKLLQLLGEGGCGTVYMAEQSEPVRRKVALKVIKLGMDTRSVIARFEAERQALAMMDHPNIARVLDAGSTASGRPYFVMELVRGVPITKYCDENNLPTSERLELFTKVCQAIQHAHQKGIIHRDIKPSNILVTMHDGVPVPKVIDFGIAKATNQTLTEKTLFTELHAFMGTPAYTSPEQAEMSGLDIDTRADIYSLGVLLYELLTGRLPFSADQLLKAGLDEMRRTIREVEPPRPSTRLSTLTGEDVSTIAKRRGTEPSKLSSLLRGDLDWIVMRALEKDRTRRYESASAFAQDIQRYLGNEAVLACPPSTFYLLQKMVRRHRLAFAAGTAVVIALLIGLSVSTWLFFKEKAAQEKAKAEAVKSEQVATFMKDMLKGVGPSVALGRDITLLREILEQTEERLGKDLKDQPDVEAELRSTLAGVYGELGEVKKAESLLRTALEMRRKLHGSSHPLVAESSQELAMVLMSRGNMSEAETLAREAVTTLRTQEGRTQDAMAKALNTLALVLTFKSRLAEAEPLHREALAKFKEIHGVNHLDVAEALTWLAYSHHLQGKLAQSEEFYREALAIQRGLYPLGHPSIAGTLVSLGPVLENQGKLSEAEAMYRECLAMQQKFLGNEHPALTAPLSLLARLATKQKKPEQAKILQAQLEAIRKKFYGNEELAHAHARFELGDTRLAQGRAIEAEPLLREALAVYERHQRDYPDAVADLLAKLAIALAQQKQWEEAEVLNRQALALWEKHGRGEDAPAAHARVQLAWMLTNQEKLPEAEARLREAANIYRKLIGAEQGAVSNPMTRLVEHALTNLAELLERQGRFSESEAALREVLALRAKDPGEEWQPFDTQRLLGASLLVQKKYADAESLLLSGYEGMKQREEQIPVQDRFRLRKAVETLVKLYEATKQPAKVDEWQLKLKALEDAHMAPIHAEIAKAKAQFGPESWEAASAMIRLLYFHMMNGQPERAEPVAREILRLREKNRPDHVVTFKIQSELGGVLTKCGRLAEAEPLLIAGFNGIFERFDKVAAGNTDYFEPALGRLVDFYEAAKQPDKAEQWRQRLRGFATEMKRLREERTAAQTATFRAEMEKAKQEFGEESWEVSSAMLKLRIYFSQTGQHDQAEPIAREVLRLREKLQPDHIATWKARSELGEVLTKRELFTEAGPLLLAAHEGIMQRKGEIKPGDANYIGPSLKRLVAYYDAVGEFQKAAEWKEKLAEFERTAAAQKPKAK